ncbi:MAG: phosphoesterase PA-phosphatase related protein [Thermomicrobiales bacterium]|nr:phosphoesterase PA-phosphatase related protein [Thermomicrobiales bacterium]
MAGYGRATDAWPRPVTRRAVLGSVLAASTALAFPAGVRFATAESNGSSGLWRTWLLTTGDELRPAKPAPPTADELSELVALQGQRTASTLATTVFWNDPTVVLPWTNLALDLIRVHQPNPVRAARALALLHVALYLGDSVPAASSFPSDQAAVAAAASTVLAYLFPKESADALSAVAEVAATSQLLAARAFRSDVVAGQAIGRAVGERAVARGKADGSDASWDGSGRLTDPGSWHPTPPGYFQQPAEPLAGTWRTWLLASGDQYRPAAPPPFQSPAWQAELVGVQEAVARRTPEQEAAVRFWAGGPGTVTPAGLWIEIARDLIVRDGLDALHAARVLALTSVAMADGFICCWDAKYTYWTARPITADPELDVLIPTPPFPSYTSGHATASTASATVLGYLFPDDASLLLERAEEAKQSRLWAGIHFPIDIDMGALGGGMIGRLVVARARSEESVD